MSGSCPECQRRPCYPAAAGGNFASAGDASFGGGENAVGTDGTIGPELIVGMAVGLVLIVGIIVTARSKAQRLAPSPVSGGLPVVGDSSDVATPTSHEAWARCRPSLLGCLIV